MEVSELVKEPLAQIAAALIALAGGWRYWRTTGTADARERADNEGQIAALGTWQQLLEMERAARREAESRADRFAAERNEALQQVWEMRGQLQAVKDTLSRQTAELQALREQVNRLGGPHAV